MKFLKFLLIAACAFAGSATIVPGIAHADGIERPRAQRAAPRRPRPARPARPAPPQATQPATAPVLPEPLFESSMRLPETFFFGPLSGGVGYAYGAGGAPGGGGPRFSGFSSHGVAQGFSAHRVSHASFNAGTIGGGFSACN